MRPTKLRGILGEAKIPNELEEIFDTVAQLKLQIDGLQSAIRPIQAELDLILKGRGSAKNIANKQDVITKGKLLMELIEELDNTEDRIIESNMYKIQITKQGGFRPSTSWQSVFTDFKLLATNKVNARIGNILEKLLDDLFDKYTTDIKVNPTFSANRKNEYTINESKVLNHLINKFNELKIITLTKLLKVFGKVHERINKKIKSILTTK